MSQLPPAIICIGRNYAAHASEFGHDAPDLPLVFFKNPSALTGNGDPIVIPEVCAHNGPQVDYEGELAVIIGSDALDVEADRALEHVAGYAVANDVSARWWQTQGSGGQYSRGKSFDTFCPISEFVPAETIPDPQSLELKTWVNGELVQSASTGTMIFPIAEMLSDLSRGMTIAAGTILLTGTPSGVGAGREPQLFLKDGDLVEVEIPGIGRLSNPVVEED